MSSPKWYTTKPVEIQALQFQHWSDADHVFRWADGNAFYVPMGFEHRLRQESEKDRSTGDTLHNAPAFMIIKTLEGDMRADLGDYIIKGLNGEFYPCKPDIFKKKYKEKA